MNIIYREATPDDFRDIRLLNVQLGHPYDEQKTGEKIEQVLADSDCKIFVAESGDSVIGYLHLSAYVTLYFDSLVNILGIVVDENYRGKGIGSSLLAMAEQFAERNGYAGVRLNSGFERKNAHIFYKRNGYMNKKDSKNFLKIFKQGQDNPL